jgi:transcriptional regulator with XRE-family HTH domain
VASFVANDPPTTNRVVQIDYVKSFVYVAFCDRLITHSQGGFMDGYSRKVGARLRSLRKQRGLTLQQVEVLSNKRLKGSLLAAYERGDRNISVTRLHQIATLYSVPVNQLLPEELEGVGEPALPPKLAIDLNQLQGLPERQGSLLARHVARLQQQRQDFNTPVVTFRADDLEQLAAAYKTSPEMLRRSLQEWGVFRSGEPGERPEIEREPPPETPQER